nr:hypothetical protein [Oligoflexus tunisiensis]
MKIPVLTVGLALCFGGACSKDNSNTSSLSDAPCPVSLALVGGSSNQSHDFIFPDGLSEYKAGTKVFQAKTGRTYECKGFPYTVYCRQYSEGSTQFEPGVGSNWMAAWDLK